MSTRPNECGYCGKDHPSAEPCQRTMTLLKLTLRAAFRSDECDPEYLGNALAESLREAGAECAASEYETIDDVTRDDDADLADVLDQQFPSAALYLGPIPGGVKVLGHNGTHKRAHLKQNGDRIELWLGTEKERYPLVTFPLTKEAK